MSALLPVLGYLSGFLGAFYPVLSDYTAAHPSLWLQAALVGVGLLSNHAAPSPCPPK